MKLIIATIKPFKLEEVREALTAIGVRGMMVSEIHHNWSGVLLIDEPMASHTSWRVGGTADYFYQPTSIDDLSIFLREFDSALPLIWLGLGSNLLVRDGGIRGTVIHLLSGMKSIEVVDESLVRVEVGAASARVARL